MWRRCGSVSPFVKLLFANKNWIGCLRNINASKNNLLYGTLLHFILCCRKGSPFLVKTRDETRAGRVEWVEWTWRYPATVVYSITISVCVWTLTVCVYSGRRCMTNAELCTRVIQTNYLLTIFWVWVLWTIWSMPVITCVSGRRHSSTTSKYWNHLCKHIQLTFSHTHTHTTLGSQGRASVWFFLFELFCD